jgi:hypothetical protein
MLVGLVVLAAVPIGVLQGVGSAATAERLAVVSGTVDADGHGVLPEGWTVSRGAPGYYVLAGPGDDADLDVTSWDGDAAVEINPGGDGDVIVSFSRDSRGADTRFAWRALVSRRR